MKLWQLRVSERQTLHMILAVCLIGVLSAFVVVFVRRQSPAPPMARYPLARWISPRATEAHDWRIRIAELDDPSLMSLPHPRAFSAALWQRQAELNPDPIQPTQSIVYLDTPLPSKLPALLSPPPLAEAVSAAAQKSRPAIPEPPTLGSVAFPSQSWIHMDESLASSARLLHQPQIPAISSETTLRPTVVRLAVAADGTVAYALLERFSGNDQADATALSIARQLRFQWLAGAEQRGLRWGTATFVWTTKQP